MSEPLASFSTGGQAFSLPNFNPTLGNLAEVTLTLKIQNKVITIFDTSAPSTDWVNLLLTTPGNSSKVNGDNIAAWGDSLGDLNVTYTKPANKSVASMGIAGLLLYATPRNGAPPYITVNYTYDVGNNNENGGGGSTPEPSAGFLSAIAAGAMGLLLIGRNLRRRADGRDAAL